MRTYRLLRIMKLKLSAKKRNAERTGRKKRRMGLMSRMYLKYEGSSKRMSR